MKLGAIRSSYDCRDYHMKASIKNFPKTFSLEPTIVKNQGNVGSCVAHTLSSIVEYFNKLTDGNDETMSTGFIYGNRNYTIGCSEGMIIRDALKTLMYCGDVPYNDFSDNVEVPLAIDLYENCSKELKDQALKNHISGYYRLKTVSDMKQHLMEIGPIVFAIDWYDIYEITYPNNLLKFHSDTKSGGHCMFIYGWNEEGWLFQNSWGKWFGENGRAVLPYDMKITEAWGVTDDLTQTEAMVNIIKPKHKYFYKIINKIMNLFTRS